MSCGPNDPPRTYLWQAVQTELPGAMLSIWGTSATDVYAVGADSRDGFGPMVTHYDGTNWTRMDTSLGEGDLWWVYGTAPDTIFMGGSGGLLLRHNPQAHTFTRMTTPGTETIFGIWGATSSDVWAVGGNVAPNATRAGVIWHFDGTAWSDVALPNNAGSHFTLFKVWGSAANDVWVVGTNSETLHYDGTAWTEVAVPDALRGTLLTIHGQGTRRYAVGGSAAGLLLEDTGSGWHEVTVGGGGLPRLAGVYFPTTGNPIAVGSNGTVVHRNPQNGWQYVTPGPQTQYDFHSVWVDPDGGVWAVGGQTVSAPLTHGMIWHFGERVTAGALINDPALLNCPSTPGSICTYAGTGEQGFNGDLHNRRASTMYWPIDLEFSPTGQPYILDWNNHRVRRVRADDTFETMVGTEIPGDGDPLMADLTPAGALGTTVALNHPTDLLFQPDGNLLICAWHNHKIRRLDVNTGMVNVLIGRGPGASGDGGPAAMALLKQQSKIVYGRDGSLFIFDQGNLRIRRVGTDGVIQTVAGNGMRGFAGDGGDPLMAQFNLQTGENPEPEGGLAVDGQGRLFVADSDNNRIRVIDFTANTINTIAGTGTAGFTGDDGPAAAATISSPRDIEIGPDGNLYIADTGNHCIRMIELSSMTMRHVAGRCGTFGYGGDRGPAATATFYRPFGIAFDAQGNLFVADSLNNRVRRIQH